MIYDFGDDDDFDDYGTPNDDSPFRCPECSQLNSNCICDDEICPVCNCYPCMCDLDEDDEDWR